MADTTVAPDSEVELNGWIIFAAVVLFVSGVFGVIWGLAAILNSQVLVQSGHGVIIADFTTWGWVHLIVGSLMILTCFGLYVAAPWSRWTAILFATLNACLQVTAFTTSPLWSMVAIALDVTVIYQLSVNWPTTR